MCAGRAKLPSSPSPVLATLTMSGARPSSPEDSTAKSGCGWNTEPNQLAKRRNCASSSCWPLKIRMWWSRRACLRARICSGFGSHRASRPWTSAPRGAARGWMRRPSTGWRRALTLLLMPGSSTLAHGLAATAVDAHRHLAGQGHAAHHTVLLGVVVHRVVLGGAVVPDRHVAFLPAPAHGVLQAGDVALEDVEQALRVVAGQALDALDEVPEQQAAAAAHRVHAHHRVLGLVDGGGEHLAVLLQPHRIDVGTDAGIVVLVAVHRPELVGQLAQLLR